MLVILMLSLADAGRGATLHGRTTGQTYDQYIDALDTLAGRDAPSSYGQLSWSAAPSSTHMSLASSFTTGEPTPQIDEGLVTVWANGVSVGTAVGKQGALPSVLQPDFQSTFAAPGQHSSVELQEAIGLEVTEHWLLHDLLSPRQGFTLELESRNVTQAEAEGVFAEQSADWESDPYAAIQFTYQAPPSVFQTYTLTYKGNQVTRYGFELRQDGQRVGGMLREQHTNTAGELQFTIEHWLFYDPFDFLAAPGDSLEVRSTGPEATTAGWFTGHTDAVLYAQPQYVYDAVGADFPMVP